MAPISSIRVEDAMTTARAQRACFAPSDLELANLLPPIYGRRLDAFHASELAVARLVFAQAALMAGAALAADSETFFGAEQLWRDMQDKLGVHERALARRFLELLARDEYYSESERSLIAALGRSLSQRGESEARPEASAGPAANLRPPFAQSPIRVGDASVERLRAQRDSFAPTQRELVRFFQAEFGSGRSTFRANEVAVARTVFGQVVLMVGAAQAADAETYLGAEQLWADMQDRIGARERGLARRLLDLLSRDACYTEGERRMIASLAATLP